MSVNRIRNQHLLWRAAFGPMAENTAKLDDMSQIELWDLLLKTSKDFEKVDVAENSAAKIFDGTDMSSLMQNGNGIEEKLTKEQRKMIREKSREDLKNLNVLWLNYMINGQAQLREKMSLFWHGHFASRVISGYFQQELLHSIRTNALGSFKDLLMMVSKSPSMLQFLNNQQNKKKHPNENFAREVMELFTMGRGNYTEHDIKEAARAFTGWGFNLKGEFVFRANQHDDGEKTFLGRTGNFSGEDIIHILLEQPQTATFITQKIYRFFVNENVDDKRVKELSALFFKNDYNIEKLLAAIFTSEWFYDEKNIGNRIKSPVELIAGIRRFLPMKLSDETAQIQLQKVLGQVLFFPPNVAGWPGGKNWIDSSSLMIRLRIPQALSMNDRFDVNEKDDDDQNMGNVIAKNRLGTIEIMWPMVYKIFEKIPREKLGETLRFSLLQNTSVKTETIEKFVDKSSRENYIRTMIIQLMSTPEYQLC